MSSRIECPVCDRLTSVIRKWRGLYICTPCISKFEKIEKAIADGQVLDTRKLETILHYFGDKELREIEASATIIVKEKKGKKKKDKNAQAGIAAPKRRTKRA